MKTKIDLKNAYEEICNVVRKSPSISKVKFFRIIRTIRNYNRHYTIFTKSGTYTDSKRCNEFYNYINIAVMKN